MFVHPLLDPIADFLLLARVEAVVPVAHGFSDVVLIIAAVRVVIGPDPEIIVVPVVVMIKPIIIHVGL